MPTRRVVIEFDYDDIKEYEYLMSELRVGWIVEDEDMQD